MSDRAPNDYALGHNHDELQRLIGQSRLLGELTEEVLRAAGIGPGMRVLDVGCGAGDVSFLAATLVGRDGLGDRRGPLRRGDRARQAPRRRCRSRQRQLRHAGPAGPRDRGALRRDHRPAGADVFPGARRAAAPAGRSCWFPAASWPFTSSMWTAATSEPHVPLLARSVARVSEALRCANAEPRMGLRLAQTFQQASCRRRA